ncbi:protein transport protein Sec16A isoform X8 [Oryzias latipes]
MQPPPRAGPPGASGPPPSGPNMFRRTRPQKSAAATGTMPPATQPMTNPFAFGQAPPPMATGGIPTIPTGNLPQMQTPPSATYSQHGSGLPPQPQSLGGVPFAPSVPPPSTLPGVPLLDHHSAVPPGVLPAPSQTEHTSSNSEQGYFNSRDQTSSVSTESPPMAATSAPSQTHFNQSFQGQLPPSNPVHFQPHPPASSFPQWAPEHTSRPPSVQNYFQPTSDPPPQLLNIDPQPQMYPPHSQSPHHNVLTPPTQPGLQNQPPLNPPNPVNSANSQWSDPNRIQQHSSSFYTQNSFSQNPAPQESWFNQIPQDYHQMGTGPYNPPLLVDTAGSAPGPASGPEPRAASASDPNSEDSGALSMFFKGNDVENEETLAGDRDKTVNGVVGSFQHQRIPQSLGGHADVPAQENSHLPYLSEGSHIVPGNTQKPPDTQFDHVENLECVPNQEVLPSESHSSAVAPHEIDQFETGPNLETPDSVPRPMRSASVSSNYSNMSHGSGTGGRRYQGAKGTFIQQESPHLAEDANPSGAAGGYFEQIDTSPAVETGMQPGSPEHIWPSTPSPPKPTGIFQTSANSSFEPVRSHGVGVRPAEVDRAKMVVEGRTECTSGNLEQPPDNMENIFGPGHSQAPGAGGGVPHATHPVVLSHSRPSSRAFGASRPCDSPATTLWAQNDPASLGVNILLAPAAPTVLAPLREPSADVIQPPEDGPLDLQPPQRIQATSQQHSENLENPPKVTKDAQHGASVERSSSSQTPVSSSVPQVLSEPPQPAANSQPSSNTPSLTLDSQAAPQGQISAPSIPVSGAPLSHDQSSALIPERPAGGAITAPQSQGPQGPEHPATSHPQTMEPPRPPSTAGSHHSYGAPAPPVPGQMYGAYYGNYGEYPDNRAQYPPGQYMPPPGDPRLHQYYQDNSYRGRSDPWYGRYEGQSQNYRDPNYQYREPPSDRPNSRASQYSDRPSSRQGYPDESRANRSAYSDYYADYSKHYEYGGYYGQLDPRYRGYYDQSYWSYYDDTYRNNYYNQPVYPQRKEGYEDQWKYYPGYDPSFDDDNRCGGEMYGEDFDRRSIHSEQSAHSVHSSHSHHSRQSSFSSRSQQSQIYRSQPDLTVDVCDNTSMAVNYSYAQYPDQTDATQKYLYSSDYTTDGSWIAPKQPPPRPATPEKFTMPHRCARFGPGGHLVQVLPNLPSAGQPALVDIYNLETMLQDTPDQAELRAFPGPLIKGETHKVDVIKFSQSKGLECSRDNNLLDRDSARLLWDFIVLLCRQNGTVVGTDIADLLLKEHRSVWLPGKSPNEANLIDFNNEPLAHAEEDQGTGPLSLLSDTFMTVPENVGKETERFRELLLFGRKKEALEAAMKAGLWGHALLLASKMDSRTHARVMTKFANSLPMNDPLQTIYQLMSGRMPASATCCGEEKWGDWRPHLAMVLSNLSQTLDLDTRTITTMGDTLASKGLTDAAHFCYLMAQVGLGVFTKKSTKLVLIGSNHSLSFQQFATNEAIQRTEAYEYAQSLGSQPCSLPNFQVFKLIYACRLAEAGLCAQAFHYCEVISKTVLMQPSYYSPVFISQIIQMSEKLRFYDPQLKEKPELEWFLEPDWLIELRQLIGQIWTGAITYSVDRRTPPQFDCRSETSDLEQFTPSEPYSMPLEVDGPAPDNPLTSLLPRPPSQEVRLMPPAPSSIIRDDMGPPQVYPPADPPQFYPVPPIGQPGQLPAPGYPQQDPGITPPSFQPQHMQTAGGHQQSGAPTQVSTHMPPPPGPHSPVQMNPPLFPAQHMPPMEQPQPPLDSQHMMPSPPPRNSLTPQSDFYDYMAHKTAGRTRTISESSSHLQSGNSSRRASISSNFSGRERANSVKQVSPPPPPIPEQPRKEATNTKKDSPNKKLSWLKWLMPRRNEAHLPDDKNPSIVWDEKKQRWVDLNEPEEETKPPPPPPSGFPAIPQMPGPGGPAAPPGGVNMFSIKAGSKGRYVDVLNPSRTAKASAVAPAPADLFAPLAPMPMPNNLFVPSSAPDDQQPLEGSEGGNHEQNSPNSSAAQMFNPTMMPPAPEGPPALDSSQSGESPPAQGPAPTGGITFYNPAQFAPTSAPSGGGVRSGRLGGPRQYPTLK